MLRLGLEGCDVGLDFGLNPSEEHPVVYIEAHLYRPGPPARTEAGGACGVPACVRASRRATDSVWLPLSVTQRTAGIISFDYLFVLPRAIWAVRILWDFFSRKIDGNLSSKILCYTREWLT